VHDIDATAEKEKNFQVLNFVFEEEERSYFFPRACFIPK
jgi:hypothetical protein